MASDTRQKMIHSAAALLQEGGLARASFTDVVNASGAARGAIYHHFPGGKTELAAEAVLWTGERVRSNLSQVDSTSAEDLVADFLAMIRPIVAHAAVGTSCAVAAVTIESAQSDPELTRVVSDALRSWVDVLQKQLVLSGVSQARSHRAAVFMVIFLEGAQVLCRATGDMSFFDEGAVGIIAAIGGPAAGD